MNNPHTSWLAIINPVSGNNKGAKVWKKIADLLDESGISYEAHHTEFPFHTRTILSEGLKKGFRKCLLVGGDGTYHEAVNALFEQDLIPTDEVTFAMLPAGTGNDWSRTMQPGEKFKDIILRMKSSDTRTQDVGWANFSNEGKAEKRFFLNVAGMGFDAYVAKKYLSDSKGVGIFAYLFALLRGLITYTNPDISVKVNGKEISLTSIFMGVGICKYFGGGMKIVPDAIPDDGLFDLTIGGNLSKMEVVGQLGNLYKGTIVKHKKVQQHRSDQVEVTSDEPVYIQMDGEVVGHTPVQFGIIPKSLRVVASVKNRN